MVHCCSSGAPLCLREAQRKLWSPMLYCAELARCRLEVSDERRDTPGHAPREAHQCTQVPGNVPEHMFSKPDITGDKTSGSIHQPVSHTFPNVGQPCVPFVLVVGASRPNAIHCSARVAMAAAALRARLWARQPRQRTRCRPPR